ncbi:hypothetical protein DFH09DRAFT_1332962 [Mycena vulgaris]|nr:hypothetical protein DFH09DRAFT_1332962 [Mycena vulgaris]
MDSFASPSITFLQGSAMAALTWILSVWRSAWTLSKVLFFFSRYHTILALGSLASRWYLGLTEVLSILTGELLILIRINAVYGWSRKIVVLTLFLFFSETVIGLVTTILSILGGSRALVDSTGILTCAPNQANVPDVNISSIYIGLIVQKVTDVVQVIDMPDGQPRVRKMSVLAAFKAAEMTPTLHLCLRDAAVYFVVIFGVLLLNLVLILQHNRYAQVGTPWLLATYSVASTRIFLNLKDVSLARDLYSGVTWSEFQRSSALEFQVQSALRSCRDLQYPAPVNIRQALPHGRFPIRNQRDLEPERAENGELRAIECLGELGPVEMQKVSSMSAGADVDAEGRERGEDCGEE